jgi:outer membrane murein-binding lipoprotein Lpp
MSDNPNAAVLAAIATLSGDVTSLRDDVTSLRSDLSSLRSDVTRFRTDIMARIDRLQARVDQIHDDVKVGHGLADRALMRAERAQSDIDALVEMQSTLLKMQRRSTERLNKLEGDGDDAA